MRGFATAFATCFLLAPLAFADDAAVETAAVKGSFEMCLEGELEAFDADARVCTEDRPFADADGDGENDATDRCPLTAESTAVDASGCSQAQFCASIAIHHWRDARRCRFVDWQNDEMFRRAEDCRLSDTDTGFICVSRGTQTFSMN